ncbi:hypothetical protein F4778DRAFT_776737 [Xylariomycetidae sp. FL2044]|nr:hypothetical protein F4778DRAFT_776737 [Xylariomycetidae sp. FL2044]
MSDDVPNRGPLINGVCWTLVLLSALFLGLRLHVKVSQHRGLWWDDYICTAAWICQLISISLISANVTLGFGKHSADLKLTLDEVVTMSLRGAINGLFLTLGAAWSKTSFGVMLLRLTTGWAQGWLKTLIIVLLITLNAFLYTTVITNFLDCNPPEKTWNPAVDGTCWPDHIHVSIDIASAVYSAFCDLIFATIPWFVVANLQMKMREKIGVGVAMSLGIFAAATGIARAVTLFNLQNQDFTYNGGDIVIWSIVEISMTIIAASIPVLRTFLRNAVSSGGRYFSHSGDQSNRYGTRTRATKYANGYGNGKSQTMCTAVDPRESGLKRIIKTEAITVSFQTAEEASRMGYEMNDLSPRHTQFPPV